MANLPSPKIVLLLSSCLLALAPSVSHSAPLHMHPQGGAIILEERQISIDIGGASASDQGGVTTSTITYYITEDPSAPTLTGNNNGAAFTTAVSSSPTPSSSSSPSSSSGGGGISSTSNTTAIEDTPLPILQPGQNPSNPASWTVYNADTVHYPFTVHVPDRTTRNLPPLEGPVPMVLSLSGSGGRGTAADAKRLSGYDGTSRFVRQYYEGNRSLAHTIAAEELLVVTPICPNETAQSDASWDINVFPNIIAQVVAAYNVDLTRIYLTTYSMGARAGWPLLMAYPDIFAGSIISSGATFAQSYQLQDLLGNSIRNYYGGDDESGLDQASVNTQEAYDTALSNQLAKFPAMASRYNSRKLETIGPLPGADHLVMNELPWQEQVLTDGYTGALSWLIAQVKEEGATIPTYNASICTTCIPTMGGPEQK